jgi:hypothetical protein
MLRAASLQGPGGFEMSILKRALPLAGLLIASIGAAHDDTIGARYVEESGVNSTDCLDHDIPCRSIQYALDRAQHGNTLKIAAGIYDVSGIDPERYLFGTVHAQGGYSPSDHYHHQDP